MPLLAALLDPYIEVANALPRVVLAPIFLLWFGLGIWSKVALGVTVVFFIVFFNTYQGVSEVDPFIVNNARMLGASERQLIRHVLAPSALDLDFFEPARQHRVRHDRRGGRRISRARRKGIGYMIAQAEGAFDTTGVFAGMAILATVVLLVGEGVSRLERRLLRWKDYAGTNK